MNSERDARLVDQVRQRLDRHADNVDALTAARLRAMRGHALAKRPRRAPRWLPVTGIASAAAVVMAVLVWQHQGPGPLGLHEEWELLAEGEELELIEELEFYDWLEQTQGSS